MVTILRLTIGVALLTATHLGMAQAWQTNNCSGIINLDS